MRLLIGRLLLVAALLGAFGSVATATEWLQTETEHFTIIYAEADGDTAAELIGVAEPVYDRVTGLLGSAPEHVTVILDGETDVAGGVFEALAPQQIRITVAAPTLPRMGARSSSWLEVVLAHELTHFVQANYSPGLFDTIGAVFGDSARAMSLALAPTWYVEGLGVQTETRATTGGRGIDPFFLNDYRAQAQAGTPPTLLQAGYDSYLVPIGRQYYTGYYIWDLLIDEFGESVIPEILAENARFPLFGIWGPIRRVTGARVAEIYSLVVQRATCDNAPRSDYPGSRISPGIGDYYLPTVTDLGLYLYREKPSAPPAIVRFEPESGEETVILRHMLTDPYSWSVSPDGATICFATYDADFTEAEAGHVESNLYTFDVESGRLVKITSGGGYAHPVIAPDGSIVATRRDGAWRSLVRLATGPGRPATPEPLVDLPEACFYTPDISPNGERVVVAFSRDARQRLALLDLAEGTWWVIPTGRSGAAYFPVFLDDDTILYSTDDELALSIYRHSLSTGERELVATDGLSTYAARVAGDTLLVGRTGGTGIQIDTMPLDAQRSEAVDAGPLIPVDETFDRRAVPDLAAAPYRALPRPLVWWPSISILASPLEWSGYGFGAKALGSDYLRRNRWEIGARYYPALTQFDAALIWDTILGPWGLSAAVDAGYLATGFTTSGETHSQHFSQSISVSYDIVSDYSLDLSRRWTVSATAENRLATTRTAPFAFTTDLEERSLALVATLSAARRPRAAVRAIVPPGSASALVSVGQVFPYGGALSRGTVLGFRDEASIGLFGSNHVVTVSADLGYSTALEWRPGIEHRGFHAPVWDAWPDLHGAALGRVEYHTPLALTDLPLGPRLGLVAIGATLFAESGIGFDPPATLRTEGSIVTGAEVLLLIRGDLELPVRLGAAFRFEWAQPYTFDYGRTFVIYLR
jgi:hypothetical protein